MALVLKVEATGLANKLIISGEEKGGIFDLSELRYYLLIWEVLKEK